jgi:hypothetical protein
LLWALSAQAEVSHHAKNPLRRMTFVEGEDWQPEDFENGIPIPAAFVEDPGIRIDGRDDEAAWEGARETELSLALGTVERAWVKALYTDEEVYIRVRWPDSSESREHRPWTWDAEKQQYVPGPQVEDSLLLSFESGCEWTPSLLGGYQYDFDGWYWLAARSDPLGQAVDTMGTVTDRVRPDFTQHQSRVAVDDWQLKFIDVSKDKLHATWDELERVYIKWPVTTTLYIGAAPDGGARGPEFVEELPPPAGPPSGDEQGNAYPRFRPLKLDGDAGDISAKGHWENGYWTVEFSRALETPVGGVWDMVFDRLVQFSVHILDQEEGFDRVSESKRLFLQFVDDEEALLASQ